MERFAVIVFAAVAVALVTAAERRFSAERAARLFRVAWLFWFLDSTLSALHGLHEVFRLAAHLAGLGFGMLSLAGVVALSGARWPRPGFGVVSAIGLGSIVAAIPLGGTAAAAVAALVEAALVSLAAWIVWRSPPGAGPSLGPLAGALAAYAIQAVLAAMLWAPGGDGVWPPGGVAFGFWAGASIALGLAQLNTLSERQRLPLGGAGITETGGIG